MAVSKRTRFEVLRRDNHSCRYCGGVAPDVKLTVDHVLPVALGGGDDPSNLVTACRDCNFGKSSTSPSESIVSDVAADALRWSAARRVAASKMEARINADHEAVRPFYREWVDVWGQSDSNIPADWDATVRGWLLAGLSMEVILDSLCIAMGKDYLKTSDVFRYLAGICRNRINELNELTRVELEANHGA